MAKRQSHKQSRIGKEIDATMALEMLTPDPVERQKLRDYRTMLREEWIQAGWERRFPHHYKNGHKINLNEEDEQGGTG